MAGATIGDDIETLYEFDWEDGPTRTSDEIGDLSQAGFDATMDDIVDVARDDPDCEVTVVGFEQ
jgi:hypothetical protein